VTALDLARTMNGTLRKQGDKQTATFSSVGDTSKFRHELTRSGIEFRDKFANGGKALKFVFADGPLLD
jgi:hypothetical protein